MTEPKPPTDALDEQERELARVLRALPGGEPPAALDQKILRAAANAAAASRRPRARWLASVGSLWGIGGAAAAVLALGITWQMIDPTRPGSPGSSRPVPTGSTEESAVTVDLGESMQAPAMKAPIPPAGFAEAPAEPTRAPSPALARPKAQDASAAPAAAAPSAMRDAAPPPPPAPVAESAPAAPAAQAYGYSSPVDTTSVDSTSIVTAGQADKLSTAQEEAREREAAAAGLVARAEAAKSQAAQAEAKTMSPAVWLARVRKLRNEGQIGEARSSLQLFHHHYPQHAIPADLAPLLQE